MLNACTGSHLFQRGLETGVHFPIAKQFAHVGAGGFIVKVDRTTSWLMHDYKGSALASLDVGLCFEMASLSNSRSFPGANVQFFDEVSKVLAIPWIEEKLVFRFFPLAVDSRDLQRRIPEARWFTLAVQFSEIVAGQGCIPIKSRFENILELLGVERHPAR